MKQKRKRKFTPTATLLKRKIAEVKGCWIWQGETSNNGYGRTSIRVSSGNWKRESAHRAAYLAFVGEIPKGLTLDHLCRNKLCVNPKHLEAVTQKENSFRAPNYVGNRTYCPSGHEYSEDNTYTNKNTNKRTCRACHREHQLAYTARQAERSTSLVPQSQA